MLKEFFQKLKNKLRELQLGKGNKLAMTGKLYAKKIENGGVEIDLGLISVESVTTVAAEYLVDAFQSTGSMMNVFKYHGYGTSTGAESTGDTILGTEVEDARSTGTQTETSSMIYKSVATRTFTTTGGHAITEHGLFSAATTGTLWDRSLFAAINVSTGDSIEFTYELTVTPGG